MEIPRPWSNARREEGRQQALAEGRVIEARSNLLRVLEARGLKIDRGLRDRIETETDLATLEGWLVAAVTAGSAADVVGG